MTTEAGAAAPTDGSPYRAGLSPFLDHVAAEFHSRGTAERKRLAGKVGAHAAATELGIRAPRRHAVIDDVADLTPDMLDGRRVLKPNQGFSGRGVMLLERVGPDTWFDHLAARARTFADIVESQLAVKASFGDRDRWQYVIEELIESTIAGRPVPFDYKFYCFRERVGMIVLQDRNSYPPRAALLKPDFAPFTAGKDYVLARRALQPGHPVVPRHAAAMSQWASLLSLRTDSPFVRIDLYDSTSGPVFGEFTFSPGTTHRAMLSFAPHLIRRMDRLLKKPSDATVDTFRASMPDLGALPTVPGDVFARLGAAAANGSGRAALTLADLHAEAARGTEGAHRRILRSIAEAWRATRRANRAAEFERIAAAVDVARGWRTGQEIPEMPEPAAKPD